MRFKLSTLLFFLMSNFVAIGQTFQQYFDGADTTNSSITIEIDADSSNVWQIGPPQKTIFDAAASVPNVIVTDTLNVYPTNNSSSFITKVPNPYFWYGIYAVQWQQKLDLEQGKDGGLVELSVDNGQTWENAFNNPYVYNFYGYDPANFDTLATGEYGFSGTDSTWRDIWFCYDLSWITTMYVDTVYMRFTLLTDSVETNQEGWMMDNFTAHMTIIHTITEAKKDKYVEAFPNPTTGRINITTAKTDGFHIIERMELINVDGRVVQEFNNVPTKFFIDVGHHPAGMYYLKVKTNLKTETIPILLQDE